MSVPATAHRGYGGDTTRQEDPMSAQPEEAATPPAPAAAAQLLAELRADHRAGVWVPAFEQDWHAPWTTPGTPSASPRSMTPSVEHTITETIGGAQSVASHLGYGSGAALVQLARQAFVSGWAWVWPQLPKSSRWPSYSRRWRCRRRRRRQNGRR
jgi:hypothetical protein